jgi:uncharacterized membrane protein YgcG
MEALVNKKIPILLVCCLLSLAGNARAFEVPNELIAVTEMPLAVAEVAALPEVPQSELITVVTTLNQALVPAPQFVEVVRYVPVALVETAEPRFVTYVSDEYDRGVVGDALAAAIANRYQTSYGITEVNVVDPPVIAYTAERQLLPEVVVTRFQPARFDALALVAMPLAVAAVSSLTDVPQNDLVQFITALNQAFVPAPQFVEVVRYSPVVLVDQTQRPEFIQFVESEVDRGVTGRPLSYAIVNRYRTVGVDDEINVVRPRTIIDREVVLPPVVVTRVARNHPQGGPPGQLRKELGLRIGAEVVHHTARRDDSRSRSRSTLRTDVVQERRVQPAKVRRVQAPRVQAPRAVVEQEREHGRVVAKAPKAEKHDRGRVSDDGGHGRGRGNGGGNGDAGNGNGGHGGHGGGGGKGKKGKG